MRQQCGRMGAHIALEKVSRVAERCTAPPLYVDDGGYKRRRCHSVGKVKPPDSRDDGSAAHQQRRTSNNSYFRQMRARVLRWCTGCQDTLTTGRTDANPADDISFFCLDHTRPLRHASSRMARLETCGYRTPSSGNLLSVLRRKPITSCEL